MGKITVEVKINTFGTMLYSLNHPNVVVTMASGIYHSGYGTTMIFEQKDHTNEINKSLI